MKQGRDTLHRNVGPARGPQGGFWGTPALTAKPP